MPVTHHYTTGSLVWFTRSPWLVAVTVVPAPFGSVVHHLPHHGSLPPAYLPTPYGLLRACLPVTGYFSCRFCHLHFTACRLLLHIQHYGCGLPPPLRCARLRLPLPSSDSHTLRVTFTVTACRLPHAVGCYPRVTTHALPRFGCSCTTLQFVPVGYVLRLVTYTAVYTVARLVPGCTTHAVAVCGYTVWLRLYALPVAVYLYGCYGWLRFVGFFGCTVGLRWSLLRLRTRTPYYCGWFTLPVTVMPTVGSHGLRTVTVYTYARRIRSGCYRLPVTTPVGWFYGYALPFTRCSCRYYGYAVAFTHVCYVTLLRLRIATVGLRLRLRLFTARFGWFVRLPRSLRCGYVYRTRTRYGYHIAPVTLRFTFVLVVTVDLPVRLWLILHTPRLVARCVCCTWLLRFGLRLVRVCPDYVCVTCGYGSHTVGCHIYVCVRFALTCVLRSARLRYVGCLPWFGYRTVTHGLHVLFTLVAYTCVTPFAIYGWIATVVVGCCCCYRTVTGYAALRLPLRVGSVTVTVVTGYTPLRLRFRLLPLPTVVMPHITFTRCRLHCRFTYTVTRLHGLVIAFTYVLVAGLRTFPTVRLRLLPLPAAVVRAAVVPFLLRLRSFLPGCGHTVVTLPPPLPHVTLLPRLCRSAVTFVRALRLLLRLPVYAHTPLLDILRFARGWFRLDYGYTYPTFYALLPLRATTRCGHCTHVHTCVGLRCHAVAFAFTLPHTYRLRLRVHTHTGYARSRSTRLPPAHSTVAAHSSHTFYRLLLYLGLRFCCRFTTATLPHTACLYRLPTFTAGSATRLRFPFTLRYYAARSAF